MTVNESHVPDDGPSAAAPLELLTDDEKVWTAVPADATGNERVSEWLSINADSLHTLEDWR
ncbi:DUF7511 domain-containing protein [Natronorubrum halophilum]|uniref:DUF7511 domain-containing protein n=1 Tax=Natronorubrum halophilum TaxID=1702106 RepID=UPI000EF69043|nr:hypothetical protein [Natronorubrum halophilum]